MTENKEDVLEFQKVRGQLALIERQKGQLEGQSKAFELAIKEVKESKKSTVLKAIGNILIEKDAKDVTKELKDGKESVDLKIATLKKQEDSFVNKLTKLKTKIEGSEKKETSKKSKK